MPDDPEAMGKMHGVITINFFLLTPQCAPWDFYNKDPETQATLLLLLPTPILYTLLKKVWERPLAAKNLLRGFLIEIVPLVTYITFNALTKNASLLNKKEIGYIMP